MNSANFVHSVKIRYFRVFRVFRGSPNPCQRFIASGAATASTPQRADRIQSAGIGVIRGLQLKKQSQDFRFSKFLRAFFTLIKIPKIRRFITICATMAYAKNASQNPSRHCPTPSALMGGQLVAVRY
jgi:hypothetical protein